MRRRCRDIVSHERRRLLMKKNISVSVVVHFMMSSFSLISMTLCGRIVVETTSSGGEFVILGMTSHAAA